MERKLAAILSADVKGYSRLMGEDDEATIRTLTAYREVMTALIEQHHGRVVDSPGDNLLAEFASAVNAVQGAVAIQQELTTRNTELPPNRQMAYRIGVNLGDVVTEDGRVYGDGVNIAARLEALADAGGICISGKVFDEVKTKLELGYTSIGAQQVKNIAEPVLAYKVQLDSDGTAIPSASQKQSAPSPDNERGPSRRRPLAALVVVVGLVVAAGVLTLWDFSPPPSPPSGTESVEERPALPLPDKPSIAVLPFTNMSGDPEQEYFSDGMTETLITDLSKLSGLFVIARHSTFFYKGKTVKIEQTGRELGVRYVLEGSVQRAGARVRINTQLIEATTGGHVWAERYDRKLEDIFALQDELVQGIVTMLRVEVQEAELARVKRVPTANLTAYDAYLRGREYFVRLTPAANAQARLLLERAIALDPAYADAYVLLGFTYWMELVHQWSQDPQTLERAVELARQALVLDDSLSQAHHIMGYGYLWRDHQHARAIAALERAIELDPNNDAVYANLADMLSWAGRPAEGLEKVEQAMRLNPHYPAYYLHNLSNVYLLMDRYEEAVAAEQRLLSRNPDYMYAYVNLAYAYSQLGRDEEARAAAAEVLRLNPHFSLEVARQSVPLKDKAKFEQIIAGLRKAGLE